MKFSHDQRSISAPLATLLLAAGWLLVGSGCNTIWRQGPVSQSVAESRRFSQSGMAAIERRDWQQAETDLRKAIEACPTDADARLHYAETQLAHHRTDVAIAQLEEACLLSDNNPRITTRTGEVYLSMGQFMLAAQRADQALAHDPHSDTAWALRGRALRAMGRPQQGLANLQRALSQRPNDPQLLAEIAEIYQQLNQPRRALVALQSCCDTYRVGDEPTLLLQMQGAALTALGRQEDAIDVYATCVQREPGNAEFHYVLARAHFENGDSRGSEAAVRQALAIDPQHVASRQLADELHRFVAVRPTLQR